jgi:ABC-2 type transport system permease protein
MIALALRQTWQVYLRSLRVLLRQPAFLIITLIQPIVWLLLFGALFRSVSRIPGFHGSYIDFFTPGVVIMLAVFSAGWSGMGAVEDIKSGVMDRMLASPVWRPSLNAGAVLYSAFSVMIQALLIIVLALILGADFKGGVIGVIVMIFVGALLAIAVASLSNAVGLIGRQRETVIGVVSFFQLPLTVLSTGMMQKSLLPHWMASVANYNPVNWAVVAARSAAMQKTDWGAVGERVGLLAVLALVSGFLASRAFRRYQRSL